MNQRNILDKIQNGEPFVSSQQTAISGKFCFIIVHYFKFSNSYHHTVGKDGLKDNNFLNELLSGKS